MVETEVIPSRNLGLIAYGDALAIQQKAHDDVLKGKGEEVILVCEHRHVYTFGKSADHSNLLANAERLRALNAEVFETDRGGDITYHGPGQLVVYPIINLSKRNMGVRNYVEAMEAALIRSLAEFDISAYQIPGLTGIWVKTDSGEKKIGAIGIRVSRGVSMHGFALNIETDLSYFNHIIPCGIQDKGVCSMHSLGKDVKISEMADLFVRFFNEELTQ